MSGEKLYIWRCPQCGVQIAERDSGIANGEPVLFHTHERHDFGDRERYQVRAEKVEAVPVDAPNVLTVEEAEIVVDRLGVGRTPEELVGGRLLWGRLSTWVEEQIDPDLTDDDIADAVGRGILSVEDEAPDA